MKKLNIFLLLSTIFTGHLISMEISEDKQETPILNLPDEVILHILERETREAINNWNDVFEEAPNLDLSLIQNLSQTCKKFRDLCQDSLVSLNNCKSNKFERLLENLKSESLKAHENSSKEELNKKLANTLNRAPYFSNSENGYKEELKNAVKLILAGADVNTEDNNGNTVLVWAAEYCHKEIAKILIKIGADVNTKDINGCTALMLASENNHREIVEMLINKGADVNNKDDLGKTALILAAFVGHKGILKMLIKSGADVNAQDNNQMTALHWVIVKGDKEIAEILINSGTDINAKNNFGYTALIWAAIEGSKEMVEMLINAGADVNAKDNNKRTALIWAVREGHKDVAVILKKTKNSRDSLCLVQ